MGGIARTALGLGTAVTAFVISTACGSPEGMSTALASLAGSFAGNVSAGLFGKIVDDSLDSVAGQLARAGDSHLPINHDVARALRRSHMDALKFVTDRYREHLPPYGPVDAAIAGHFLRAVYDWCERERDRADNSGFIVDTEIAAERERLRSFLDQGDPGDQDIRGRVVEDALDELTGVLTQAGVEIPLEFLPWFSGADFGTGWLAAAHAYFAYRVKSSEPLRTAVFLDRFATVLGNKAEAERKLEAILGAISSVEEGLLTRFDAISSQIERLSQQAVLKQDLVDATERLLNAWFSGRFIALLGRQLTSEFLARPRWTQTSSQVRDIIGLSSRVRESVTLSAGLDAFVDDRPFGLSVVYGAEPEVRAGAIAAWIARRKERGDAVARHFAASDFDRTLSPVAAIGHLMAQVESLCDQPASFPVEDLDAMSQELHALLRPPPDGDKLIIVVDGVDALIGELPSFVESRLDAGVFVILGLRGENPALLRSWSRRVASGLPASVFVQDAQGGISPGPSLLAPPAVRADDGSAATVARAVLEPSPEIFQPPVFADHVRLDRDQQALSRLLTQHGIVSVEGLSGSGKTYLVAGVLKDIPAPLRGRKTFWYDPPDGVTLDGLVLAMGLVIDPAMSVSAKARSLVAHLERHEFILVIDDYQRVDPDSFGYLVRAALASKMPSLIVTISQIYVESPRFDVDVMRYVPLGFDASAAGGLIGSRAGMKLDPRRLTELIRITGGLPLAITLFATLLDLGHTPDRLLGGDALRSERIERWLAELLSFISPEDRRLLEGLSLIEGPFGKSLSTAVARTLRCDRHETSLAALTRRHLLRKHGATRWSVHRILAARCEMDLDQLQRLQIRRGIARHFAVVPKAQGSFAGHRIRIQNLIAASRYFGMAGDFAPARQMLSEMAKDAKLLGEHQLLIRVMTPLAHAPGHADDWFAYHFAHSLLACGHRDEARRELERALSPITDAMTRPVVSMWRLLAEVYLETGQFDAALGALKPLDAILSAPAPDDVTHRQILGVKLRLCLGLSDIGGAEQALGTLLRLPLGRASVLAQGILSMQISLVETAKGNRAAALSNARHAFAGLKEAGDARGIIWSGLHLGLCLIEDGSPDEGGRLIVEMVRSSAQHRLWAHDTEDAIIRAMPHIRSKRDKAFLNDQLEGHAGERRVVRES